MSSVSTRANVAFAATGGKSDLFQLAQPRDGFVRVTLRAKQLRPHELGFGGFARPEHGRELIERIVGAREIALRDAGFGARESCARLPQRRIETEHALRGKKIAPSHLPKSPSFAAAMPRHSAACGSVASDAVDSVSRASP